MRKSKINQVRRPKKQKVCKKCGVVQKVGALEKDKKFYRTAYSRCIECQKKDQKCKAKPLDPEQLDKHIAKMNDKPMVFYRTQELRELYNG